MERNPWEPREAPFGELTLPRRRRIACISRRNRVLHVLTADCTYDDWLDALPPQISRLIIELS